MSLRLAAAVAERGLDVEFTVDDGETVAVLGPNGAGKSTLLGLVSGLVRADSGTAELDGSLLFQAGRAFVPVHQRGVCLLAQDPLLFPNMSVLDNVAFGPRSRGASRADAKGEALKWLGELDAVGLAGRRPAELSGGQAQRVAIARALAAHPRLLLLDEPLAALDIAAAPAIRRTLRHVLRGRTAVIVTHDVLDALMLADRVVIMNAGSIVEQGPTREVLERPRKAFTAGLAGLNRITGTPTPDGLRTADGVLLQGDWGGGADAGDKTPSGDRVSASGGREGHDGGPAVAVFRPSAVSVLAEPPPPGTANVIAGTVTDIEPHGDLLKVRSEHITADVTPAIVADLDLAPGAAVHFAVDPLRVTVYSG